MKSLTLYLITPEEGRTFSPAELEFTTFDADDNGSKYVAARNLAEAVDIVGEENVLHTHRLGDVILAGNPLTADEEGDS